MTQPLRTLVVGLGTMGLSHLDAYRRDPGFRVVGLCNRSRPAAEIVRGTPFHADLGEALAALRPDLVAISTWSDSHADYAIRAMEAGAHVFVEKPLATTLADARRVAATARRLGRKLVIGYILRHHPSWIEFIRLARDFGGPFVMRMNLNQQSSGAAWEAHRNLMRSLSPIVDCGVHYVDVMCQICDAAPVQVRGMGTRLSGDVAPDMYNYGHLQVLFADGSCGWYEAAWGPMISEAAFFVKDVMTPRGSVSMIMAGDARSDDIETHTRTATLRVHDATLDEGGGFARPDRILQMDDEPGHQLLCDREQAFVLRAIREDLDLSRHMDDAVRSLAIVLAADRSVREMRIVEP